MVDIDNKEFQLGLVKWFGGYNKQKERENDFGFIESSGEDIFIHKNEINSGEDLDDDELVFFEVGDKKGKKFAKNLYRPEKDIRISSYVVSIYVKNTNSSCECPNSEKLEVSIRNLVDTNLNNENIPFLKSLREEAVNSLSIYNLINESRNWYSLFRIINGDNSLKNLLKNDFPTNLIPPEFLKSQEESYYNYVKELDREIKNKFYEDNINDLSIHLILASILENLLTDGEIIDHRFNEINTLIESKFRDDNEPFPEYLDIIFKGKLKNKNDYKSNPTIHKILEPIFLKRSIYKKKSDIKSYFDQSKYLKNNSECLVLAQLFSLIQAKNTLDVTYQVFLHYFWESLVAKEIDINDIGILNLFPSCSTLGLYGLSCEAFYWPKTNKYICRGRVCRNPQVKPDSQKHFLDFNIYDWFHHYGINYTDEGEPSKKDFPIKLAGYVNRLKEIFNILHCRECNKLMKPDMRYARVEYIDYESGEPVRKAMDAAYRATVFECANEQCQEHKNKFYISHCLGFGCGSIIDTRDLKIKCDNGLYICRGCGSCCEQHAKANPVGLCPDCGSFLNLFENQNESDKFGIFQRFVKCSNTSCDFTIDENLPKKFTLPSCTPVKKVAVKNDIQF